jgi:hypothetical protein
MVVSASPHPIQVDSETRVLPFWAPIVKRRAESAMSPLPEKYHANRQHAVFFPHGVLRKVTSRQYRWNRPYNRAKIERNSAESGTKRRKSCVL